MSATSWFENVPNIPYEGPNSDNPLAFTHYNADEMVAGKSMRDHLRFAVCYWHAMRGTGADPFGVGCRSMPWSVADDEMQAAHQTMDAMFEFVTKLGALSGASTTVILPPSATILPRPMPSLTR